MLQYRQINRLLTTIVASMVVLTAVASVDAQLPQRELTVVTSQLRSDCSKLMSDPRGQQELIRVLRQHRAALQNNKHALQALSNGGVTFHSTTAATIPELLVPDASDTQLFTPIFIDKALLTPEATSHHHIRAPGLS